MNRAAMRAVGDAFDLPGALVEESLFGTGHINDTYGVRFDNGGAETRFILQRINQTVFKDVPAVMENIARVTHHIRASLDEREVPDRSRRVMTLLSTSDGCLYHVDPSGGHWRAYEFVEGASSHDVLTSDEQAYEIARAFGTFQALLADLPEPPLHETIPHFHDGPHRFRTFLDAVEQDPLNRAAGARPEVDFLIQRSSTLDRLPALLESGGLPLRVTHNDCKCNNVLIDDVTGEGICVIDLDTLMPGLVAYDFGDMVRTGTCAVPEDWHVLEDVHMNIDRFESLTRGYLSAAGGFLTPGEIDQLASCGQAITLALGARFLTDHLRGDTYFKIHRPDHNLERCRTQFALVQSMVAQEGEMMAVVERAVAEGFHQSGAANPAPHTGTRRR